MREEIHSKDKQYLNSKPYLKDRQQMVNALGKKSYLTSEGTFQKKVSSHQHEHKFNDRGTLVYYH